MDTIHLAIEFDGEEARGAWAYHIEFEKGHRTYRSGRARPTTRRALWLDALAHALPRIPIASERTTVAVAEESTLEFLRRATEGTAADDAGLTPDEARAEQRIARCARKRGIAWLVEPEPASCEGLLEAGRHARSTFAGFGDA